MSLTAVIV